MRPKPISQNQRPLAERRVLVVEDDYFIAEEVCSTLRDQGAEIVGPSPNVDRALQLIESHSIDCAVLDVNLQGSFTFGIAKELRQRGVPAIFVTGYDVSVLPREFSDCIRLEKPVNLRALLQAVQSACAHRPALQES